MPALLHFERGIFLAIDIRLSQPLKIKSACQRLPADWSWLPILVILVLFLELLHWESIILVLFLVMNLETSVLAFDVHPVGELFHSVDVHLKQLFVVPIRWIGPIKFSFLVTDRIEQSLNYRSLISRKLLFAFFDRFANIVVNYPYSERRCFIMMTSEINIISEYLMKPSVIFV